MNTPLVSVIIPAYNYGHLIIQALESVSVQTYTNWECIVVDDGSTDETESFVEDFIRKHADQNFKYVRIPNSGPSTARNTGIELACGTYLQFLDADDLISKNKLAVQTGLLQSRDCALVYAGSCYFVEKEGTKQYLNQYPPGYLATETLLHFDLFQRLIKNNLFPISAPLVHTELVKNAGNFDSDLNNNEDWLFWFKIALLKPQFVFDESVDVKTEIRVHTQSAMNNSYQMFLGEVAVRQYIEQALQSQISTGGIEKLKKYNADLLALHHIRSLDLSFGVKYILSEFGHSPFRNFNLICKGCFRFAVRVFKSQLS